MNGWQYLILEVIIDTYMVLQKGGLILRENGWQYLILEVDFGLTNYTQLQKESLMKQQNG